ncbi:MAG: hypothetical protein IJV68_01950 [Clostridia bacterium]|nr:hypothetical protein [Clostridia bacterium]
MTRKNKIITLVSLVLVLCICTALLMGCANTPYEDKDETIDNVAMGDGIYMKMDEEYKLPIYLSFSPKAMAASYTGTVFVNVSATVYPENAQNKKVDWSVEWADTTNTENVSNYITVTPSADGSTQATITCHKAFEGEILVTVTTREGKHSDTCVVTFLGNPTSIEVSCDEASKLNSSAIGDYYAVGSGNTYTFNITPMNSFGKVGAKCDYTYSVRKVGYIIVKDQQYNTKTDEKTWVDGTGNTVDISTITKINPYYDSIYDCSISGNQLNLTINCTLENYYASSERDSVRVYYRDRFQDYMNDYWYYEITVTETNSGLTDTFRFRPMQTVSGVTLSMGEYSF